MAQQVVTTVIQNPAPRPRDISTLPFRTPWGSRRNMSSWRPLETFQRSTSCTPGLLAASRTPWRNLHKPKKKRIFRQHIQRSLLNPFLLGTCRPGSRRSSAALTSVGAFPLSSSYTTRIPPWKHICQQSISSSWTSSLNGGGTWSRPGTRRRRPIQARTSRSQMCTPRRKLRREGC